MIHRENIEWCNIWVPGASENTCRRVLLIGDSITLSYHHHVEEQLAGQFACARLATSKCVAIPSFFRELGLLLDEFKFACIHFNNGLHGWDYDEAAYAAALAAAFDLLVGHCGASRLVWGSTTPVWAKDGVKTLGPRTERVRERNRIAADLARSRNVLVNDLYAHVIDRPELFSADGVHFNETGQALLGGEVAATISRVCKDLC